MLVIPALDLKDHRVVRLKQGQMDDQTIYSTDVIEVASRWVDEGATRLHLVDLNGAFLGTPVHADEVRRLRREFPKIKIQIGGGIRTRDSFLTYIDAGVDFCILGTIAIKQPELLRQLTEEFPHQVILGVDAKQGMVATEGWAEGSQKKAVDLIKEFSQFNLQAVIYTDIDKDGALSGMNFSELQQVATLGIPVIASGGLTTLDDIDALKVIPGVTGVIAGKAIYENRFSVREAIERAEVSC